jgi:hypothetical protein
VTWNAPTDISADLYELQLAVSEDANVSAVLTTEKTTAMLDFLVAGTSYWIKVRAHVAGSPSKGPGTWQLPGPAVECKTGDSYAPRVGAVSSEGTFLLEVLRQSEYTYDVDYLGNHNSGDIGGDTAFVVHSSSNPDQKGFLNTTFRKSTFTLYCVEVLAVHVPNTVTTDGVDKFADYLSCDDNHNATNPLCACDNAIDRSFSKKEEQMKYCRTESGEECTSFRDCHCNCTRASLDASAKYTGMMPYYDSQPELVGHWYSHPVATECKEDEPVGHKRADGTQCTWKGYSEARVVQGADVLAAGWNTTSSHGWPSPPLDPALVKQNVEVFRKVFDSKPYQQWSCSDAVRATVIV